MTEAALLVFVKQVSYPDIQELLKSHDIQIILSTIQRIDPTIQLALETGYEDSMTKKKSK